MIPCTVACPFCSKFGLSLFGGAGVKSPFTCMKRCLNFGMQDLVQHAWGLSNLFFAYFFFLKQSNKQHVKQKNK